MENISETYIFISMAQAIVTSFLSKMHQKWCWKSEEEKKGQGEEGDETIESLGPVFVPVFSL